MRDSQTIRTAIFVGVAVVAVLLASVSRPRIPRATPENLVGQELFPDFKDPLAAVSLEIIKYDESTATLQPFKVALVNNRWSIPSHENYPADAKDQLAEAAASLIGLKILELVTDRPGDHALYGVVDPDPRNLEAGTTGVGMRVVMRDKDDQELLNLVIGKEVPGREGLRYVRRGRQDPVFVVAIKTDKLSTRFEDWIERDLLQLNTWDIRQVAIDDYSIDIVQGVQIPRSRIVLDYDDREVKWTLRQCQNYENGQWVERLLAEDEELDTTKLNDMKWALDDLKIVDVRRKPAGMTANLRELGEIKFDPETRQSLADRGFYPVRVGNRLELLSSEGEVTVVMKDGVQYVLRFGGIAAGSRGTGGGGEGEAAGTGTNRYLFVMAEFNQAAIPAPELEELPELPPEVGDSGGTTGSAPAAGEGALGESEPGKAPTDGNGEGGAQEATETLGAATENRIEGSTNLSSPEGREDASAGNPEQASGTTDAGQKPADDGQKPDQKTEEGKPDTPSVEELKKKREEIEKENKRKLEEYEEKVKKGQERVRELNQRFAEWYYVISDEVYRKIRLGRADIVRKKTKVEDTATSEVKSEASPAESSEMTTPAGSETTTAPSEDAQGVTTQEAEEARPASSMAPAPDETSAAEEASAKIQGTGAEETPNTVPPDSEM